MADQDFVVPDFMEKREIARVMYTEADIKKRCQELGNEITAAYKGNLEKPLIVICTLKGAAVFFSVRAPPRWTHDNGSRAHVLPGCDLGKARRHCVS